VALKDTQAGETLTDQMAATEGAPIWRRPASQAFEAVVCTFMTAADGHLPVSGLEAIVFLRRGHALWPNVRLWLAVRHFLVPAPLRVEFQPGGNMDLI
jgi:hypothetical protein